jgi:iron complex transport system ATP-binding protein
VALGRLPHLGLFGTRSATDEHCIERAMHDAGCAAWAERRLGQLSGGERQRGLLARALAVGAPVLLLDEPTTHLDPPQQVAVVRLLRRLGQQGTVVSVLHDLPLALQADRVLLMRSGRVVASGVHDDPALHDAMCRLFDGAVRIQRVASRFSALPNLQWAPTPGLPDRRLWPRPRLGAVKQGSHGSGKFGAESIEGTPSWHV